MVVRETLVDDWRELRRVRLESLLDAPEAFGQTHAATLALSDAEWQRRADGRTLLKYFAAFDGSQAIGLAAGASADAAYELISMWLHPSHRGTGIAADLVRAVAHHGLASGHPRIGLEVAMSNTRAWRCYHRCGFRFTGRVAPMSGRPDVELHRMELSGR